MNLRAKRLLTIIIIATLISLLFLQLFSKGKLEVGGLDFDIGLSLSLKGNTQLEIPPLGLVRAYTHKTPLKITIRLQNINLEQVQLILGENPNQETVFKLMEEKLRREVVEYIVILTFACGFCGLFAALLMRSSRFFDYLAGFFISAAMISTILASTYLTYNVGQFARPEFTGMLKAAPWMISLAEESIAKIDSLNHKLELITKDFEYLFSRIDNLQPVQTSHSNIRVLHVSDIHNDPAAIEFIGRMAEIFNADLIIDTGDISDFGTPIEGMLMEKIRQLPVPYVFVAGNHDSPETVKKMKTLGNNVIVAEGLVRAGDLNILGIQDPVSDNNKIDPMADDELEYYINNVGSYLEEINDHGHQPVDIVAVHNNYIARRLAGKAPVFLFGHDHRYGVGTLRGSVMVNAGTTGASGVRTMSPENIPYSMMLLHFTRKNPGADLLAVDSIQVDNLSAEFSIKRFQFNDMDGKVTQAPTGTE